MSKLFLFSDRQPQGLSPARRARPGRQLVTLTVGVLALCFGAGRAAAQATVTAITNVAVIPMDMERVLPGQTVLVQGGRITALGPAGQIPVPATAVRIDGRGKFLIPGLANMHAHNVSPDSDGLFAALAVGVTTLRDMHSGGANSSALRARQLVNSGQLFGPHIYTAGDPAVVWFDPSMANTEAERKDFLNVDSHVSLDSAVQSTEALKAEGHDFVKLYGWPRPIYDSVMAAANRVGLRVVGHVPYDVGVKGVLKDHWASIEHLTGYFEAVTGLQLEDSAVWAKPGAQIQLDTAKLHQIAVATRQAGVWNCPTLVVFLPLPANNANADTLALKQFIGLKAGDPLPLFVRWGKICFKYAFLFQIVKALQDAGAGLLLGTDIASDPAAVHQELALLVQAGLTPYQALATGTRNVAAFLGTQDSAGTIAVGKWADFVLLDGNPLTDITSTAKVAGVMRGGRWISRAEIDARLKHP